MHQQSAFVQTDSLMEKEGKHGHDGHESEPANLNQQKNDELSEDAPMGESIENDKTGNAGCACGGKKRVKKRGKFSRSRGHRKTEQQCSDKYNEKKACNDQLRIRQLLFEKIQNQSSLFFPFLTCGETG